MKKYLILFTLLLIQGCGGDESAPTDSATNSNWDQMEWDKGTWSN